MQLFSVNTDIDDSVGIFIIVALHKELALEQVISGWVPFIHGEDRVATSQN